MTTDRAPRLAARLVTAWTARYTAALPTATALTRRMEIASDLWEQQAADRQRGRRPARIALALLLRAAAGAPADVVWSVRQRRAGSSAASGRIGRTRMKHVGRQERATPAEPWRPLPEVHRFDQLNSVVDVTDQRFPDDGDEDGVVARNAANITANISAGGLQ